MDIEKFKHNRKGIVDMNQYVTGKTIRELREKQGMTQLQLAEKLNISDKTVSKWETGKGYPDISLLKPIAEIFSISVLELLSGNAIKNTNIPANMLRSKLYVCPVCGNVIHSVGETAVSCHGILLAPAEVEENDGKHSASIETVEDEYFVQINHEMTKEHYISFIVAVSLDRLQIVKLYPEGNAEARFKKSMVDKIYYYCNRDGLFCIKV